MEKVTLRDLNAFTAYLKEYETDTVSIDGKHIKRIRRNSAYGINRKLSGIRGLFSYLYKNDLISQNVTDKLDFKKLHQKMKRPLTSQETVNLLDVIYNGEKLYRSTYGNTRTEKNVILHFYRISPVQAVV